MSDVNWWLMALSFALGLVLTAAYMIRRVKREVPVYGALAGGGTRARSWAGDADVDTSATAKLPKVDAETARMAAVGNEPYGAGSLRLAAGAAAPTGYTIKGNEDSMLYHTTESPFYKETIAELWFRDTKTAERAGFSRWDKVGGAAAAAGAAAAGGVAAKFASTAAEVPPGPLGPGSAAPGADGSGPAGWTVKGNEDSMLYHTPESPSYTQTIAEVWFSDEDSAQQAGFTPWHKGRRGRS